MKKYSAYLFDLNGTMIDDMHYHIKAWHRILNELGASITMEKMKEECYGKNAELLERMFPVRFSVEEKNHMSLEKEKQYQHEFRPQLELIAGLDKLLIVSHAAGIQMAIGSAAIMFNIDFVLDGLKIRKYFDVLVSADNVSASKPDPETWLSCAKQLGVASADCLVFEDSPKGVDAALRAGMDCVVIKTMHQPEEFDAFPNVIKFIDDFNDL